MAAGSGVELRLLGWQFTTAGGSSAGGGESGSATAIATLRNVDSRWTEFIVDVAAVGDGGVPIFGFGTARVSDLAPGALGAFTMTIPDGVPEDAQLGVANVWGRTPGDPQIHPINFAAAEDPQRFATPGFSADGEPWNEAQLMMVGSQFAASVATMQQGCRADTSLAGLVCLSRRNFPDYLLNEQTRKVILGQPFFHQAADPTGPPRAFELTAPGESLACVGQRIDKQTSDQVAILGSCSQRGLYPGDGAIQALVSASNGLPQPPPQATRSSTHVGPGGLPGVPVAVGDAVPRDSGPAGIGDSVRLGELGIRVDGVQVGLTTVPGLPTPVGTHTLVTVTVTNPGSAPVDLNALSMSILDAQGDPLAFVAGDQGVIAGWPPQPTQLSAGASVNTTVALDVAVDQTAVSAIWVDSVSGEQAVISLLPPPS